MIHTEPEMLILTEYLRQIGVKYVKGKDKIEKWKKEYLEYNAQTKQEWSKTKKYRQLSNNKFRVLTNIEEFYDAEEFWFDDECDSGVEAFFNKYGLNLLGWNVDYFRRKLRAGIIQLMPTGDSYVNNKRKESVEQERV